MKIFLSLLISFGVVITGNSANAAVITFTDRTAWESAMTGASFTEESFDGATTSFTQNSTGNPAGIFTVDMIGGVNDAGPTGLTGSGFFQGEVDSSSFTTSDGLNLLFRSTFINGFGLLGLQNDSLSTPGGLDLEEIGIEVAGERFLISDILGLTDPLATGTVPTVENSAAIPFIGFSSTTPINNFLLVHGDHVRQVSGGNEEFYLNGIVVATASVPEPATMGLLASGLLGLGFIGHRRRVR